MVQVSTMLKQRETAGTYKGGATCGTTASPTANTDVAYYSNYEPYDSENLLATVSEDVILLDQKNLLLLEI